MSETDIADRLLSGEIIPILAIVCGSIIAVVAIVFTMIRGMVVASAREKTKREMAAYVAEGTIDAEKAVAILQADKPFWEKPTQI